MYYNCHICQIFKKNKYFKSAQVTDKADTLMIIVSALLKTENLRKEFDQIIKKILRIIKSVQIWTILSGNQKPKL